MYSCILSLILALDGGGLSMPHPGCFIPGKETLYPLYRVLGGSQGWSGRVWKILPDWDFDPWAIQLVASHDTELS